jgi:hypothetical protein
MLKFQLYIRYITQGTTIINHYICHDQTGANNPFVSTLSALKAFSDLSRSRQMMINTDKMAPDYYYSWI